MPLPLINKQRGGEVKLGREETRRAEKEKEGGRGCVTQLRHSPGNDAPGTRSEYSKRQGWQGRASAASSATVCQREKR